MVEGAPSDLATVAVGGAGDGEGPRAQEDGAAAEASRAGAAAVLVRAALTAPGKVDVTGDDVMQQALTLIIKQGGDTDTVAAIVCGVLALRGYPITPAWLERRLENGRYGTDYLHSLGARLLASPAAYP